MEMLIQLMLELITVKLLGMLSELLRELLVMLFIIMLGLLCLSYTYLA